MEVRFEGQSPRAATLTSVSHSRELALHGQAACALPSDSHVARAVLGRASVAVLAVEGCVGGLLAGVNQLAAAAAAGNRGDRSVEHSPLAPGAARRAGARQGCQ